MAVMNTLCYKNNIQSIPRFKSQNFTRKTSSSKKSLEISCKNSESITFYYSINETQNNCVTMLNCDGVFTVNKGIPDTNFDKLMNDLTKIWTPLDDKHVAILGIGDAHMSNIFWIKVIDIFRNGGAKSVSFELRES